VILMDVNVLLYAHREDAEEHKQNRAWLDEVLAGPEPFGISELVLSGFVRVATHPRVFVPPSPLKTALAFASALRSHPRAVVVRPGARHWDLIVSLCADADARGNHASDAYHAALAIESGCEWITTDRGFGRFRTLRWRHPLDG
jgi:uncharacterized protein